MDFDFIINVLLTVLSLILLMVPGWLMAKLKMLSKDATDTISTLVLYCCQTMLLFMCFQSYEFTPELGNNMLYVFGLTLLIHLVMIILVSIVVRGRDDAKVKCVRFASVFSNCGYMGVPFISMLFGDGEIMIYTAIILAVWNILNWTFGVYMMTKDKKQISVKKTLLNPVIIAVILGFLCFVIFKKPIVDLAKPGTVLDSFLEKLIKNVFDPIGKTVTPLSMTVIGMRLANINFKQLFAQKLAYLHVVLKLILMPFLTILVLAFLPISLQVKQAVFFCLAMPAATGTTLFAVKFNGDADFASVCVLLSTIFSIITIPLTSALFTLVTG